MILNELQDNKKFICTMAKSKETFGKKEKEKKRLKERQEKHEKMEERKANARKGKSLEDMMAYIDEDGNISSTPPDPKKEKSIQAGRHADRRAEIRSL